jgi:phospholipase C
VFDHTSLIKFIETRYADEAPDIVEPNITAWRRAVVGDLTSAFDFARPNRRPVRLPNTAADAPPDTSTLYPDATLVAPANPGLPAQESGVRPARALPTHCTPARRSSTAVLHVQSARGEDPRACTVQPHRSLTGDWALSADGTYDLSVHGPNGFFRRMTGSAPQVEVAAEYGRDGSTVSLTITNLTDAATTVTIEETYSRRQQMRSVVPGQPLRRELDVERSNGWYEVTVTVAGDTGFTRVLAGHVENGTDSTSDPALGRRRPPD